MRPRTRRDGRHAVLPRPNRIRAHFAAAAVILLAVNGCTIPAFLVGGSGEEEVSAVEDTESPFGGSAEPEPEPEPEPTEQPETGPDTPTDAPGGPMVCTYDGIPDGQPMAEDVYMERIDDTNFELERIVMDMDAELFELEQGTHDWRSLLDALEELAHRFTEVTVAADQIVPPEGAEEWHVGVIESWMGVCEALNDGMIGTEHGDDEAFQRYVDALREFPSLMNDLHANTMVGPFEAA